MRSFTLSTILGALMLVLMPRPAFAWFELLDYLSGPGRFYGPKFDFRVKCFGPSRHLDELDQRLALAIRQTLAVRNQGELDAAKVTWSGALATLKSIGGQTNKEKLKFQLFEDKQLDDLIGSKIRALELKDIPSQPGALAIRALEPGPLKDLVDTTELALDQLFTVSAAFVSTGIFVSLCSPDIERTWAIETGYTTMQADSNTGWAHDYPIRLNTLSVGLSRRLGDFVDEGVNLGLNHFSSRGMDDPFWKGSVEPFIDIHGATGWVNRCGFARVAALLTLRVGAVWFFNGFEREQFAGAPDKQEHLGSGPTFSYTLFFDVTPLVWRRTRVF